MTVTSYEADETACPQIEQELIEMGYEKIQVIAKCIGSSDDVATFNLNYDPYTSSVLAIDERYENFYIDFHGYDYDYGTAMRTVKTVEIPTVNLDKLDKLYPIDFLSLDTQGSELQILKGAASSLDAVLGIETEISFRRVYKKGALFGEVCACLADEGFDFICFVSLIADAPMTMPYSGRAGKLHAFGDALFLRTPALVVDDIQRRKLIFIALAYGQVELAHSWVKLYKLTVSLQSKYSDKPESIAAIESWLDFVNQFIRIAGELGLSDMPLTISDVCSVEQSWARFDLLSVHHNSSKRGLFSLIRSHIARLPIPVRSFLRSFRDVDKVAAYLFGPATKLELLYRQVGLHPIAKRLKRSRFRSLFPDTGFFFVNMR